MSEPPTDSPRASQPPSPEDPEMVETIRGYGTGRLVFNRFRLIRELGKGGMGVVWLANDERLGLEVALKFLPGMVAADPEALHDLRKEITRCLKLTHVGIVRVYDLHEDSSEGLAAIAMEYVDGTTLAQEKAKQPDRCFDVEEPLIGWVKQICEVLQFVHEQKVVHRDLKPGNIMITKEGRVKIADFGIAATLCDSHSRLTQHPGSSGTPVYMSPQQAVAQNPCVADDIYSLGATLYELLTSKPPFFRGSMAVILNAVALQVPPTVTQRRLELGVANRPQVPVSWESTLEDCLRKVPDDRPRSFTLVHRKLSHPTGAEIPLEAPFRPEIPPVITRKTEHLVPESAIPFKDDVSETIPIPPRRPGRSLYLIAYIPIIALLLAVLLFALSKVSFPSVREAQLTLKADNGCFHSAKFSPDGASIVTASQDNRARVWDSKTGDLLVTLEGHTQWINDAIYSPRGDSILSISDDHTACLWDAKTGNRIAKLDGNNDRVSCGEYSPDGSRLVTVSRYIARVWELNNMKLLTELSGHQNLINSARFSPDGKWIVTASYDGTAIVWNSETGQGQSSLKSHAAFVKYAEFSPDGKLVLSTAGDARLWEPATGSLVKTFNGIDSWIFDRCSFSPDGRSILVCSQKEGVRVVRITTGTAITMADSQLSYSSLEFSPDGKKLVGLSNTGLLLVWRTEEGSVIMSFSSAKGPIYGGKAHFSPDGSRVLSYDGDGMAKVWQVP